MLKHLNSNSILLTSSSLILLSFSLPTLLIHEPDFKLMDCIHQVFDVLKCESVSELLHFHWLFIIHYK